MTDTSAWFALGGVLGGVALTGAVGLVTAGLNHRWGEQARVATYREQEIRAIRDQRREVCHNYLVATNLYWQAVEQLYLKTGRNEDFDSAEHMMEAITALQDAYVYLTISCGANVRARADSYNAKLYDLRHAAHSADHDEWVKLEPQVHQARKDLREAMRTELGVPD